MNRPDIPAMGFPDISSFLSANSEHLRRTRKAKVCIVTPDLLGLVKNGGIGTACHHTAIQLAKNGLDVTVLFTAPPEFLQSVDVRRTRKHYRDHRIKLVVLADAFADDYPTPVFPDDSTIKLSYYCYQWLKTRAFDVVLFTDWHTTGYFCMLAKKQGLAFASTCLAVQIHSPSVWGLYYNKSLAASPRDMRAFHMERETIRNADFVTCPTQYLLKWVKNHGFSLPAHSYFQPYVLAWPEVTKIRHLKPGDVKELVFFGRLEERKGIHIFCDALDRLAARPEMAERDIRITFLGKPVQIGSADSLEYIEKRKTKWPWRVSVISNLGATEAIDYLKDSGRVAMICPTEDNSPLTVHECMYNSIPFLATNVGGIPEMVACAGVGRGSPLFESNLLSLAAKLNEILTHGISTVLPAKDPTENSKEWSDSFTVLANMFREKPATKSISKRVQKAAIVPRISVCMPHFNRPEMLQQALESLRRQTFKDFEVILVDDGSTKPEAIACLRELEGEFSAKGWQIVRQENQYPAAARNNGARHARGEYLLFMDDDNYANPDELQVFHDAMTHGNADVLVCFASVFQSNGVPDEHTPVSTRYLPLGNALNLFFFENALGDTNFMIRRQKFLEFGGFTTDYGVGYEDFEILSKMVTQGFNVQVLPEVLFWYRKSAGSVNNSTLMLNNLYRVLRPVFDSLSNNPFADAVLYLFAQAVSQINAHSTLNSPDHALGLASTLLTKMKQFGIRNFAVYGAGIHTMKIASALRCSPVKLLAIIDDNPQLHGSKMLNVPILSMQNVKKLQPEAILISSDTIEDKLYQKAKDFFTGTPTPILRLYHCYSDKETISKARNFFYDLHAQQVRKIVIYGAGQHSRKIMPQISAFPGAILAFVDDNPSMKTLCGWPVLGWEDALRLRPEAVVVSSDAFEDVLYLRAVCQLEGTGIPVYKIYNPHPQDTTLDTDHIRTQLRLEIGTAIETMARKGIHKFYIQATQSIFPSILTVLVPFDGHILGLIDEQDRSANEGKTLCGWSLVSAATLKETDTVLSIRVCDAPQISGMAHDPTHSGTRVDITIGNARIQ